jgi:hypothetical protein
MTFWKVKFGQAKNIRFVTFKWVLVLIVNFLGFPLLLRYIWFLTCTCSLWLRFLQCLSIFCRFWFAARHPVMVRTPEERFNDLEDLGYNFNPNYIELPMGQGICWFFSANITSWLARKIWCNWFILFQF